MLLHDAVGVHVCNHGRSKKQWDAICNDEQQGAEQIIGNPRGELGDSVGSGWNDQHACCLVCEGKVFHLPALYWGKEINTDWMSRQELTGSWGKKMCGMGGHDHIDIGA